MGIAFGIFAILCAMRANVTNEKPDAIMCIAFLTASVVLLK